MDIFEAATRQKLLFPYRGQITAYDLWDLKPAQLNEIYQTLKASQQEVTDSLIEMETVEETELNLKIEVVKYVFSVRKQEAAERANEAERKEKKRRLQEILARKQEEGLNALGEAELQEMIKNL